LRAEREFPGYQNGVELQDEDIYVGDDNGFTWKGSLLLFNCLYLPEAGIQE